MEEFLDHKVCCIKGCDLPSMALSLCNKHWRRNKLYGSPAATRKHSGMFIGKTPQERFKLQHRIAESGCWEWTGGKDQDGYGLFRGEIEGQMMQRAHRWSWAFHNKSRIPTWGNICHKCDNPSCVNPEHLWLGTVMDNQTDKHRKGRARMLKGEELPWAKLDEEKVRAILADPRPSSRIAEEYGISNGTVSDIKRRKSWAHLDVEQVVKHKRLSHRIGVSQKLNEDAIRDIRASTLSGKELAAKYGISPQQVCGIRKRRAWKHVI